MLEIIDPAGRHTVLFHQGLIVNASAPDAPDLGSWLEKNGYLTPESVATLRKTEEAGVPIGVAAVEMNLISVADLARLVVQRVTEVVTPLVDSRDGEFNFILSDAIGALDIEYDVKGLFPQGGIAPQKVMGGDGEKLKPLRGLEESMRVGKALLRGTAPSTPPPPVPEIDFGIGRATEPAAPPPPQPPSEPVREEPFDLMEEEEEAGGLENLLEPPSAPPVAPVAEPQAPRAAATGGEGGAGAGIHFKVDAAAARLDSGERNVVLFERNPLLRVAAKRAFTRRGLQIAQYGMIDDARKVIAELLKKNAFFITFLEHSSDDARTGADAEQLLAALKKKNHLLPVVVIDRQADMKRRARILSLGADHYLTRPSEAHLQPALAEEQLALFAEELVAFAQRSFAEYDEMVGGQGGERLYALAHEERVTRSFDLLKSLINEISDPNDIRRLLDTILRLSGEYLDRAVIFVGRERQFVGLAASGATGDQVDIEERATTIRIPYGEPSVLADVAASGQMHHGKIRRTAANAELISRLGSLLPTEVVVLPITHKGRVIGLLYGDNAEQKEPIGDLSGLELFLSQAGFAFENAVIAGARRE